MMKIFGFIVFVFLGLKVKSHIGLVNYGGWDGTLVLYSP